MNAWAVWLPAAQRHAAITLVCEIALEWGGEYGFSDPNSARDILRAVTLLRPELTENLT